MNCVLTRMLEFTLIRANACSLVNRVFIQCYNYRAVAVIAFKAKIHLFHIGSQASSACSRVQACPVAEKQLVGQSK